MNVIIIPAFNPDTRLIELVSSLKNNNIIVIDDGSTSKDIFDSLEDMGIIVIHHPYNMGKGCAIKTGIKEANKYYKNINAFITADADGQHSKEDIINIYNMESNDIIFGTRDFKGRVPLRSKIGNKFSSLFLYFNTGMKLNDTQTGLRRFPYKYRKYLLDIEGNRFEYEMNVLNKLAKDKIIIKTVPIKTIYENNHTSHFHTVKDSLRIYHNFFKYVLVALLSAIIDLTLFTILIKSKTILISTIIARIISGTFNFTMNKSYIFKSNNNMLYELIKYIVLFITCMFSSAFLVKLITILKINTTLIKAFVDILLFITNYFIQKHYIFKNRN